MQKKISLIILVRNEEMNLRELKYRLDQTLAKLRHYAWEILAVDNASTDGSGELISEFCRTDENWRYIQLSRNFTAEGSITAGLSYATGDAVGVLVSDLQDPPEILPELVKAWEGGAEVVYGKIESRNDGSWLKNLGANIAYQLIHHLSDCKIPKNSGSCHLLDRKVVDVLKALPEVDRYFRGLVHWVGFSQVAVPYRRAERKHGESKAGLVYLLGFALNAVISFSSKPLRFIWLAGLFITLLSLLLSAGYLVAWLAYGNSPPGVMTVIMILLFALGTQSFFMGIIGEYVAAVFRQSKGRPIWIVRQTIGFPQDAAGSVGVRSSQEMRGMQ